MGKSNREASEKANVLYPNRALGFERAMTPEEDAYDTAGLAQVAVSNLKRGEQLRIGRRVETVVAIGSGSLTLESDAGRRRIQVFGRRWEQFIRDVEGALIASQHGVDCGNLLEALGRDPAFARDSRGLPLLRDRHGRCDTCATGVGSRMSACHEPEVLAEEASG